MNHRSELASFSLRRLHEPATQHQTFKILRIAFGVILAFNALYQMHPAYAKNLFLASIAARPGQAAWYVSFTQWVTAGVQFLGAPEVAIATVVVGVALAVSMLGGIRVRLFAWVGVIFTMLLWITVGHLGGPYTQGATDPGTLIVYALVFVAILLSEPTERSTGLDQVSAGKQEPKRYRSLQIVFGLLWAFDAIWKWTPFFLHNPQTYLIQSEAGQPAWIVAYIQFFVDAIGWVGPLTFGIIAALAESVIALGLLSGRGMRWVLPFGLVYSFGVWTTAEGWGGPYGSVTGVGGDVLGTTIIYCLVFLYLMVMFAETGTRKSRGVNYLRPFVRDRVLVHAGLPGLEFAWTVRLYLSARSPNEGMASYPVRNR